MFKINIKPKVFYFTTIIIFAVIILFFTAIYPQSMDEFRLSHDSWVETFRQLKFTLSTDAPRFTVAIFILFLRFSVFCKILFTILNPFVQLFIIFGMFFVATGKKVNFNTTKDFYPFLLLIFLYLFVAPKPSQILFWISGAIVYPWAFVPPLILLCLFRKTIDGKELKSSTLNSFLMTFCGFAAGMSNENTGPMMFGLTVLFLIYCKYKKIKIPSLYYFALAGIILGLTAMFGSGATFKRLKWEQPSMNWLEMSIFDKMFLFLVNFNRFLEATFWLPIFNILGLILILIDKKSKIAKDKNFILSSLFCLCGFALSFALFMAPSVAIRTFYSSAMFFFISFIMMLFIVKDLYKINLFKYLTIILFIFGTVLAPLIAIPHITLYSSDKLRRQEIAEGIKRGKKDVYVNRVARIDGPTENLSPFYYDILWPFFDTKLQHDFRIKLRYEYNNEELFSKEKIKSVRDVNNYDKN